MNRISKFFAFMLIQIMVSRFEKKHKKENVLIKKATNDFNNSSHTIIVD